MEDKNENPNVHTAETVRPPASYPGNVPMMRPEAPYMLFDDVMFETPEPGLAEQVAAQLTSKAQRK